MSELKRLRHQLNSLRRARRTVRVGAACAALAVAVLWALLAVFALDVVFELSVLQRLLVLAIGVTAVIWAAARFAKPLLLVRETNEQMALLVEKNQHIDSDLIAALQFESGEAACWGSPQLEGVVIHRVAALSNALNVFDGFSRELLVRRAALMVATMITAAAVLAVYPQHAQVFLHRLALGSQHYPSATIVEQIAVNQVAVFERGVGASAKPLDIKSPEGRPVSFLVQCRGRLPQSGQVKITAVRSGQRRTLELTRMELEERKSRLVAARDRIAEAAADESVDVTGPWADEIGVLLRFDAPEQAESLAAAGTDRTTLRAVVQSLNQTIQHWPGTANDSALYAGTLGRLIEEVDYAVFVGDAWTDKARLSMIPLPVVEPQLRTRVPEYARARGEAEQKPGARQISVLEGSEVQVSLACTNGKRLTDAWMIAQTKDDTSRFALAQQDPGGVHWTLEAPGTPFAAVSQEIRFQLQVTDEDGLHLESPIRGYVRLRPDRPPSGTAPVVHRVVLPEARPVVEYRVNDDYGIAAVNLQLQVQRARDEEFSPVENDVPSDDQDADEAETVVRPLLDSAEPILADRLPLAGSYQLDLSPLRLVKGDRLKLTLELTDFRGALPGETYWSDPIYLEISDDEGVLAAISEADERTDKRLNELIRRELGIGETP